MACDRWPLAAKTYARAAGDEHVNSGHFKAFLAEAPHIVASTPLIISHSIDATGWSEIGEIKA